ncbi:F-actin-capping protein subunit alpha [Termitomyces sp. J132]|nr:F-actin-capping protein subunit alpha [Termitomyces sp. J132]
MDKRVEIASNFLLQSPPGEINDVINDVRNIVSDDDLLKEGLLPAIRTYNLAQFIVVDVPGTDHQSVISEVAREAAAACTSSNPAASEEEGEGKAEDAADEERFLDPRSMTSFVFNHLSLEASDIHKVDPNPDSEPFRKALEAAVLSYITSHYLEGVGSVFALPDTPNQFIIQIVANKYNATNYWSGRWRSEYVVDLNENKVTGKVQVSVHYYEEGNVQLATMHDTSLTLPPAVVTSTPSASASKILALIGDEEGNYQTSLNETYQEMGEKTSKGLRRALPLTRQKIDWDKVLGYKLGAELTSSKGVFGNS